MNLRRALGTAATAALAVGLIAIPAQATPAAPTALVTYAGNSPDGSYAQVDYEYTARGDGWFSTKVRNGYVYNISGGYAYTYLIMKQTVPTNPRASSVLAWAPDGASDTQLFYGDESKTKDVHFYVCLGSSSDEEQGGCVQLRKL
ncbi:hypothetical protein OG568_48330 (plasmid) [Streptomyces sp. NBC_01450]|uniref:hypothetical protein n=1 Tax=Streptomyces sp. NBC_01450 TaxID=2903871 RepID=UPI002E32EC82|nr:hypothetical protein [Streptomyces sp. NBC_01450]